MILIINCGSSSLKFGLYKNDSNLTSVIKGNIQNINSKQNLKISISDNKSYTIKKENCNHFESMQIMYDILEKRVQIQNIAIIVHRVVHGGECFSKPCIINDINIKKIASLATLAPLHNPINLVGINAAIKMFPNSKQFAAFDTSFHQSMQEHAYRYPLSDALYKQHGIRKYGFHGYSHKYVAHRYTDLFGTKQDKIIVAHLGNGASVTAIDSLKSQDTTMEFTPVSGLMMGSRCGSVDPGVILHLMENLQFSCNKISNIINKESGLLSVSQISNDMAQIESEYYSNSRAKLAIDMFCFIAAKNILAMSASLDTIDALVFTGGIGENSSLVRAKIVSLLSNLKIKIDVNKNNSNSVKEHDISCTGVRRPKVLVIPTDEEIMMAKDALSQIKGNYE